MLEVDSAYFTERKSLRDSSIYTKRMPLYPGNVFGGGDTAKVVGNTEIRLNKGIKMNETSATELLNLIR